MKSSFFYLVFFWVLAGENSIAQSTVEVEFLHEKVDDSINPDPGMAAFLKPFREGVEAFASEVIGIAAEPLTRRRPEGGLSNLAVDSLRAVSEREFGTAIEVGVINFGGLRRNMPEGELTMGLLTELSPFDNYLTFLEVEGELILELAKQISGGAGLAVSGMTIRFDEDGELTKALVGGEPIDLGKRYRMASIDYLVGTRDSLFKDEWIVSKIVSEDLVLKDSIVLHLSVLNERGVKIFEEGDGRVGLERHESE
ncbi:MAG: 5'-nucleotidase C-terminal domain-containing protein [Verrucomicrobiota bacterium]